MPDFIPLSDVALRDWARGFADSIAAAPDKYGLQNTDAQAITQVVEAYEAAHELSSKAARNRLDVLAKNQAKKSLLQTVRKYAGIIRANPAVSCGLVINLGFRKRDGQRTPITAPLTRPQLNIVRVAPLIHVLTYADVAEEESQRIKPRGVVGLQLFCHVGDKAPADPLDARFNRLVTRLRHTVEFKHAQVGQTAFYFGRWQTATGDTGPWSQVLSMTVAG